MKKNLLFLTGIVFLITILVAGGCKTSPEPRALVGGYSDDPTAKHIRLKDSLIDDTMHLFMYDKKSECGVIDDHLIVVKRNHTVKWKNAKDSKIEAILYIRPVGDSTFWGAAPVIDRTEADSTEFFSINRGVLKLVIPDSATLDTLVKYEIGFTVQGYKDTVFCIDPYLKIPKQQ